MMLKYLFLGLFVKFITGFDDTITHIPVLASVARTRLGKLFFSIGTLLAICLAIIIALFFSELLKIFPYYRYVAAVLIFLLALAIHFDIFVHKPRLRAEKRLEKPPSFERCTALLGVGFIASFATVLDDIIAYAPVLMANKAYTIIGILAATVIEILAVIYFSGKITKIKYKEEIASVGLMILGGLILLGVV